MKNLIMIKFTTILYQCLHLSLFLISHAFPLNLLSLLFLSLFFFFLVAILEVYSLMK